MENPLEQVRHIILNSLPDAHVDVCDMTGTQDHLEITVASDQFKGKLLIEQHQVLMDILKPALSTFVHAVKLKTMTKEKFLQQKTS